jgi:hypothetical protein
MAALGDVVTGKTADRRVDALFADLNTIADDNLGWTAEQLVSEWLKKNTGVFDQWAETDNSWAANLRDDWEYEGFADCLAYLQMDATSALLFREEHVTTRGWEEMRKMRGMKEIMPSHPKTKETANKIDIELKDQLGTEALTSVTGASCDLKKLVEFILSESVRLGHVIDPADVTIRITLDGADIAGRKAELVALIPTFRDDCQSLHAACPLCLFIGKETRQNVEAACQRGEVTIKQQMAQLREKHQYAATGRSWVRIKWQFSADMFGALKVLYKDRCDMNEEEAEERGPCLTCNAYKDGNGWHNVHAWVKDGKPCVPDSSEYSLEHSLFDVDLQDMCFCALHANLRMFPMIWRDCVLSKAMELDVRDGGRAHVDAFQAAIRDDAVYSAKVRMR